MVAFNCIVRPAAAAVTFPKVELVMLVPGLLQRTKLKGFCASARRIARTLSVISMRLASDKDSLLPEKPRSQSKALAVLPSWNSEGAANAAAFRYRLVAGLKFRGLVEP